ncbi:MAG: 4-hydroxy-tetrahydrodipicolinate synthase [Chitinivibrionales bacterium]
MELKGCYPALVTPFDDKGEIDEQGLRDNIKFLIDNSVSGIVPCGTTGESATLSWEEHLKVMDIAISEADGRVKVIAGAGSNSTTEAVNAADHARKSGADAILCITPYYNKPTQEGLFNHYYTIFESVDIPVVIYNVPGRTGVNIHPETVERLSKHRNAVGIKEASCDLAQISDIHRRCKQNIAILSGEDSLTLPILSVGGTGVISVTANILPEKMASMISCFLNGESRKAMELHEDLFPVMKALFYETNPIPVKAAMNILSFSAGSLRLPLVEMSDLNKKRLRNVLEEKKLI